MKPLITVAVQCHNFQKRFTWMISSLTQQTKPGLVEVDVAHVIGNGSPKTEDVCGAFTGRLSVRRTEYPDISEFQFRGLVRNRQMKQCGTEWMMFGDCDMVYHPEYFERLLDHLSSRHARAVGMLSTGRTSNPVAQANTLVNSVSYDPVSELPDAWSIPHHALDKRPMRNVGAGFSQIVNMETGRHGMFYVEKSSCRDARWDRRGSNPKSDIQFRRRMGGTTKLPQWFSDMAIHLNHNRDPDTKRHLTEQR